MSFIGLIYKILFIKQKNFLAEEIIKKSCGKPVDNCVPVDNRGVSAENKD